MTTAVSPSLQPSLLELRHTPLDVREVTENVSHPGAGAVVVFSGVVRNQNAGQAVTALEYHAYAPMAERQLHSIAMLILAKYPGIRIAALHRLGHLQVGDLAVLCAVSSVHRAEAFQACHELIDAVKAHVPIWKREHGPHGPYWVGWQDARCHADGAAHQH